MMKIFKLISCLTLTFLFFNSVFAYDPLRITIKGGIENTLPIAVIPFGWSQASSTAPVDLAAIISNDLSNSGHFNVMEEQDLPQRPTEYEAIDFSHWHKLGIENILIGTINLSSIGDYSIGFRLVDVYRQQQIAGFRISAKVNQLRHVAHQISDIIFEKLTGVPGIFDTRIAYIRVNKNKEQDNYSLQVADSDGHNAQVLLESKEPLLSPSWSPDGKRIAYVSFEGKNSAIYVQDLYTGERERISAFDGINSAPNFSPDGSQLALTLSKDGNTEIYIMDIADQSLHRITQHLAIDTEPTWSPDGRKLAFTSDRGGTPQIYEVNLPKGEPRRISFQGHYNAAPSYSPDSGHIAVVHGVNGIYRIGILDRNTGNITILSSARLDESPSFAPNGSMIMYATQGIYGAQLAVISTNGRIRQRLGLQKADVREPVWGPFLNKPIRILH